MPLYNQMRAAYGLRPIKSFTQITGEDTDNLPAGMTIDDPAILDFVSLKGPRWVKRSRRARTLRRTM